MSSAPFNSSIQNIMVELHVERNSSAGLLQTGIVRFIWINYNSSNTVTLLCLYMYVLWFLEEIGTEDLCRRVLVILY